MACWKQQALIQAPLQAVWDLLTDPARFPEWSLEPVEVTGVPTQIEKGSDFRVTARGPLRMKGTTTFRVEELDDMREIKVRCQTSGFYSHWLLTDAQGGTFADVEYGVDPEGVSRQALVWGPLHTKRYLRRAAENTLDGLQRALASG